MSGGGWSGGGSGWQQNAAVLISGVGNTLDQAYDQGGAGAGRIITADAGAVRINNAGVDGSNALELNRTGATGNGAALSVVSGVVQMNDNELIGSIAAQGDLLLRGTTDAGVLGGSVIFRGSTHATLGGIVELSMGGGAANLRPTQSATMTMGGFNNAGGLGTAVTIRGGDSSGGGGGGGAASVLAGNSNGAGNAGIATMAGGAAPGAGTGGDVRLAPGTSSAGTAGVVQLFGAGGAVPQLQIDANVAVKSTGLLLSENGAAVKRVSIGANDTGGAGFSVLRVPN